MRANLITLNVLPPDVLIQVMASPTTIWKAVDPAGRDAVLQVYCDALNKVWWLTLAFGKCDWEVTRLGSAGALMFVTLAMRNLNLKQLAEDAVLSRRPVCLPLSPQTPNRAKGLA